MEPGSSLHIRPNCIANAGALSEKLVVVHPRVLTRWTFVWWMSDLSRLRLRNARVGG